MTWLKELKKTWRFVAFFTDKYHGEARGLWESLRQFDVSFAIVPVPNLGSWDLNTQYKSEFVRTCLQQYHEDLVYIDCDARLEKYPSLFDTLDTDIAFWRNPSPGRNNELASGTVYFNNNDQVKAVVQTWCNLCSSNFHVWDQVKLDQAIHQHPDVRTFILPVEYCAIFDHPLAQGKENVITHYQASRRLKEFF